MDESKIVLSDFLRDLGEPGPADWESVPENERNIFVTTEEMMRDVVNKIKKTLKVKDEINLYIINASHFGAFATKIDSKYYVGINLGTIAVISDFFSRLVLAFRFHSDGRVEKVDDHRAQETSGDPLGTWSEYRLSDDLLHNQTAGAFSWQALNFIIAHELAHILLGHCDFDELSNFAYWSDKSIIPLKDSEVALISQALEMQADAIAVRLVLLNLPDPLLYFADPDAKTRPVIEPSLQLRIAYTFFSIFFVFRLFDELHWNQRSLERVSHPPAPMRVFGALGEGAAIFEVPPNSDLVNFRLCFEAVLSFGDSMFALALGRATNKTGTVASLLDSTREYLLTVEAKQREIIPRLKPLFQNVIIPPD